jgi:acetyltransferase-like isoleucine patch superfamily enzyme
MQAMSRVDGRAMYGRLRSWLRPARLSGASEPTVKARTSYYRWRYRAVAQWGAGVQVRGRLHLSGPGRIVIGDACVFGSGGSTIHAAGPGSVRIGDGCHLEGLDIRSSDNVTFGSQVRVRARLRIDRAGRVAFGDGCDVEAVDIIATGDVRIGVSVRVYERLHFNGAGHIVVGDECKINVLDVSATGDVTVGTRVRVRSRLQIGGEGRVVIGDRCEFESSPAGTVINAVGTAVVVRIGEGCGVNGLDVYAADDVTIGNRCMVGECTMVTTDFHSTDRDRWSREARPKRGPITVGTNVWLANRTVITKNVSIGDNSVVSIGTIVREDVPANVIVSSHEQRIVKEFPGR